MSDKDRELSGLHLLLRDLEKGPSPEKAADTLSRMTRLYPGNGTQLRGLIAEAMKKHGPIDLQGVVERYGDKFAILLPAI